MTGADYDYQTDESYAYDENGNRTTANGSNYVTGDANQLLSEGTYCYVYDAEGSRTLRYVDEDVSGSFNAGDTDITTYSWDYRNRLTSVSHFDDYADYTGENPDQVVQYAYDYQNRLVRKTLDSDGDGDTDASTVFINDGNQIALQFDKSGAGNAAASDLSHRYLWCQAVDQLFADEQVADLQTAGDILWPLVDDVNTVRDLATYDSQQDETTIANHRIFDAYGRLTDETNSAVTCLFGFTGRAYDNDTGLQNNLNRWYDAAIGRWLSEDPIGYAGGTNSYRYVDNKPTILVDSSGLHYEVGGPGDPCRPRYPWGIPPWANPPGTCMSCPPTPQNPPPKCPAPPPPPPPCEINPVFSDNPIDNAIMVERWKKECQYMNSPPGRPGKVPPGSWSGCQQMIRMWQIRNCEINPTVPHGGGGR